MVVRPVGWAEALPRRSTKMAPSEARASFKKTIVSGRSSAAGEGLKGEDCLRGRSLTGGSDEGGVSALGECSFRS